MPVGIGLTIGFRDGRLAFQLNPFAYGRNRRPDVLPPRLFARLNPAQQLPEDDPTPRRKPSRQPFPRGPAANDPIFNIWRKRLARLLGRAGGPAVLSAEFMAVVLESLGQAKLDEAWDASNRQRNRAREQRRRRTTEVRTSGIDPAAPPRAEPPEFPQFPRPQTPGLPQRVDVPGADPGVIVVPPGSPGLPNFPQLPIPAPVPLPRTLPVPDTGPGFWPGYTPAIRPDLLPFSPFSVPGSPLRPGTRTNPKSRPAQSPRRIPTGDLLTPPNTTVIQNPFVSTAAQPGLQLNPRRCPQRRCKKPKRKLRRKCYKGLYKEGRWSDQVDFTRWVEVNCKTGRETSGIGKHVGV